jgi:hypothetical protein
VALTPQEEFRLFNLGKAIDFALEGLRSAILINGAAAIALLTFASGNKTTIAASLKCSLLAFGLGVFISTIAMLLAYIAQLMFAEIDNTGHAEGKRNTAGRLGDIFQALGALCFLIAMVAFLIGMWSASTAIL